MVSSVRKLRITSYFLVSDHILCDFAEGRSRFARLGLFVHITAGFMQPGINNRQVLEIYNASSYPLELVPGTRICQFIFMKMSGTAKYQGRFSHQEKL